MEDDLSLPVIRRERGKAEAAFEWKLLVIWMNGGFLPSDAE